jgi:hypothetical protein
MQKNINLASTDSISKAQLDQIMKNVAPYAKKRALLAKKAFDKKIQEEIKDAQQRFSK